MRFGELAEDGISADGSFTNHHHTYSYGAHAAHVAVDPNTGHVEVLDYVAVEDVGRIINPATLRGQVLGAAMQGLGGTLLERFAYDDNGQPMSTSFADYLMATAADFPNIRVFLMEEEPSPINPLGAKGAGEGGIIPVGGVIANAVASALQQFGAEPHDLPLSPRKVWELIEKSARHRSRGRMSISQWPESPRIARVDGRNWPALGRRNFRECEAHDCGIQPRARVRRENRGQRIARSRLWPACRASGSMCMRRPMPAKTACRRGVRSWRRIYGRRPQSQQ